MMFKLFFKTVLLLSLFSAVLVAQKDNNRPSLTDDITIGCGFKFSYAPAGFLGDITNNSVGFHGAELDVILPWKKDQNAFRIRIGQDRWGSKTLWSKSGVHLKGTEDDRSYPERWTVSAGYMYFPKKWKASNGSGGVFQR